MFKNLSIFGALIIGFTALIIALFNTYKTPKIAFVRSHDLIYKYEGTREAQARFEGKKSSWQSNLDTLSTDLQKAISRYNQEYLKMALQDRKEMEKYLQTQKEQLQNYSQAIEVKAKEEDEKMMQSVLNQVNSFVEEYGQKNGYDIILGTTLSGNVLYGEKYLDITDKLLEELNRQYKGGKNDKK